MCDIEKNYIKLKLHNLDRVKKYSKHKLILILLVLYLFVDDYLRVRNMYRNFRF